MNTQKWRHLRVAGETLAAWLPAVLTGWLLGHIGSDDPSALVETKVGQLACLLAATSLLLIGSVIWAWRRAVMLRDEFLIIASHELRTPLASLQLAVDNMARIVQRGENVTERVGLKVQVCHIQIDRLTTWVDSLLEAPDISGRGLQVRRELCDMTELVRDVLKRLTPRANHAGCALELSLEEHIDGRWDPYRLAQAVSHLVDNAIKYGAGKPIGITLRIHKASSVLTVKDAGMGIAREDQRRIFERFERAVSVQYFGGMGLGLFLVREIANAHGGTVQVSSEVGQGSTFCLSLPRIPRTRWYRNRPQA